VKNKTISPGSSEEKSLLIRCMVLTGALLVLDQVTKAVIEKYIDMRESINVIPHFFDIVKIYNTGAAWGIFAGQRWPLLAISIAFFLFALFYGRKLTEGWPERYYALALVISGIFGNSVDRIWRDGKVRTVSVRADTPKESPKRAQRTIDGVNPFEGLNVVNMSPALAEEMDFDPYASGVVIAGRGRRGLSSRFRFRTGDMLLQVMGVDITSTEQLQDVLDEYDGERSWTIKLDRGGRISTNRIRF